MVELKNNIPISIMARRIHFYFCYLEKHSQEKKRHVQLHRFTAWSTAQTEVLRTHLDETMQSLFYFVKT